MGARHKSSSNPLLILLAALAAFVSSTADGAGWKYKVLHNFGDAGDGAYPVAGLTLDKSGNLYGTAKLGGVPNCDSGCGVVFSIAPNGAYTSLYRFAGSPDGGYPIAGVLSDESTGVLTGTTGGEGAVTSCSQYGCGTIFRLAADGTETILHNFDGTHDGYDPVGMVQDAKGNFYGVASYGGTRIGGGTGCGTLFRYAENSVFTVLYTFNCAADGLYPLGGLIRDRSGNLYGVTLSGSTACGSVYRLALHGKRATESVLYSFGCGNDGETPEGLLAQDPNGNLYGVTYAGGAYQEGVVFRLAPDGTETVLHSFGKDDDGYGPAAGPLLEGNVLYGTTEWGGAHNDGTVYALTLAGKETILYSFDGTHGSKPAAPVAIGRRGVLYGTAYAGGTNDAGVVFRLGMK